MLSSSSAGDSVLLNLSGHPIKFNIQVARFTRHILRVWWWGIVFYHFNNNDNINIPLMNGQGCYVCVSLFACMWVQIFLGKYALLEFVQAWFLYLNKYILFMYLFVFDLGYYVGNDKVGRLRIWGTYLLHRWLNSHWFVSVFLAESRIWWRWIVILFLRRVWLHSLHLTAYINS